MSQTTPENFKDAYHILKTNTDKLEQSQTLDIDNLVTIVEESLAAYRICQSRIEAVEQALQSAFEQAEVATQDE
ncbi:exodeoxyribonuclease VII small subunit [Moraxella catarrhalis]|uniref:Exodeoxyribonuclease VII small subunit n=1 Tax=Moraxella catarrhalis TaxID=480 RepID=A0A198UDG8_MORCA|nr:exodeoxyribonuclease VII small subunit [Moraxella catarrhalis]OAU94434.1 Exodeoxyribonuclease VII small subunit [Moraxella catarrhalis]OAU94882.1 Exodeoxyribonuclease VII small subunit [Moraxella catarrhalis]OAU99288.1 Exodeoxyribonuclease VII small subunit [Moraxella catarrhalis]